MGDNQFAGAAPQHAHVGKLLGFSITLGIFQSLGSMIFFLIAEKLIDVPHDEFGYPTGLKSQTAIWLQVSISAEFLIYSARAPGLWFCSKPSNQLIVSTMLGNILCTVLAATAITEKSKSDTTVNPFSEPLTTKECVNIWIYDIVVLFLIDAAKMAYKFALDSDSAGVIDEGQIANEDKMLGSSEPKTAEEAEAKKRESRRIVDKRSQVKKGGSIRFLATGAAMNPSGKKTQSVVMNGAKSTRTVSMRMTGDALRKRTPATVVAQ